MAAIGSTKVNEKLGRPGLTTYRPGDLATSRAGYPVLYEVLGVQAEGLLRVRGLNWANGYTAIVAVGDLRPVSGGLTGNAPA